MLSLQKQAKDLKEERDSIVIEEEDSLNDYYTLLQQYRSLKKEVRDIVLSPKYCLSFLQPGRLVRIQCTRSDVESPPFSIEDQTTWGVIISFERVKGLAEGKINSNWVSCNGLLSEQLLGEVAILKFFFSHCMFKTNTVSMVPEHKGPCPLCQVGPVLGVDDNVYQPFDMFGKEYKRNCNLCRPCV